MPGYRFLLIENTINNIMFKLSGDYSECHGLEIIGNAVGDKKFEVLAKPNASDMAIFKIDKEGFSFGGPI